MGQNVQRFSWGNMNDWELESVRYHLHGLAHHETEALLGAGVNGALLLAMLEDELDGHRALVCPRDQV